jgi:small subunit ribosomal protein S3
MGQKVHPVGFRLGVSQSHKSQWFAKPTQYAKYVAEDAFLRDFFTKKLQDAVVTDIHIQRQADLIQVTLFLLRPQSLLDANGKNALVPLVAEVKKRIPSKMSLSLVRSSPTDAVAIAEDIALQLEKRVAFRRAMKRAIQQAQKAKVKGIKIQISGRLNGAEIARSEWAREGRVPLHTLRVPIDYCTRPAQTIYGVLGIKVWVQK